MRLRREEEEEMFWQRGANRVIAKLRMWGRREPLGQMFTIRRFTETACRQSSGFCSRLSFKGTNVDRFKAVQTPVLIWQANLSVSVPKSSNQLRNRWKVQIIYMQSSC